MTPVFTINFRREVYLRELARVRRRLLGLSGWVLYFGVLGVVVGLYGLNCFSLVRRVRQIERQAARLEAAQSSPQEWTVDAVQLGAVERFHTSPRRWRDKLVRLAEVLPTNVALSVIAVNPDNLGTSADQNKMVITGHLRALSGQDATRGVVQLVSALQRDAEFASGYQSIKLAQSRATGETPPTTEFVIECR